MKDVGLFADVAEDVGETTFEGKSGDSMTIEGIVAAPEKSGESMMIEEDVGPWPFEGAKDGESIIIDGRCLNEGDWTTTGDCVFDVPGVLPCAVPETGGGGTNIDATD